MTINISSQSISLTIGSQNWTNWIESIQIGYGEYDAGSGLMPCTGTINLIFPANYAGIPSNPEYRFNANQWRRGQLAQISVSGSPLPCSGNALKIIKPPQRPNRDQSGIARMALSVGCALAYEYFPPEPNDDFSGITAGTPVTYGGIIGSVLSRLGIPSNVNVGNYAIAYPLPKLEGNWLDFCGQLADSAGWYLRCDTDGVVVSELILNNGASGITYTIGADESDWTAIGDVGETPIEKLIVTGVKKTLDALDTDPNVVIEKQPFSILFPDVAGFNERLVISKLTTKTKSKSSFTSTATEKIEEPFSVLFPDVAGFNERLVVSKRTMLTTFYTDGLITKISEKIEEPFSVLFPDVAGFNERLVISKLTVKEWTKIGDQKYRETFTEKQPFSILFPDVAGFNERLVISKQTTIEGESAPPTDQPISDFNLREEQIKSEVFAAQLAVSEGRDRQRTISLPYAVDESQLSTYGQIFNKLISGRSLGWQFATRLNTTLLPMQTVRIIDETRGYILRTDAMQWAMTQTEAYVVFNGIEDGVFNTATPNQITYPVSFPIAPLPMILIADWSVRQNLLEVESMILQSDWTALSEEISGLFRLIPDWTVSIEGASLNDNILAYWKFESIVSGFAINELGNTNYNISVPFASVTTGKIGNTLNPISSQLAESLPSPFWTLHINNFVGFALWVYPDSNQFSTINIIRSHLSGNDEWKLFIDYDTSPEQIILQVNYVDISDGITLDEWNLVICEIDQAATTFTLKVNANAKVTGVVTPLTFGYEMALEIKSELIDELFFFSEPLTTDDIATIYNSGDGATYPF